MVKLSSSRRWGRSVLGMVAALGVGSVALGQGAPPIPPPAPGAPTPDEDKLRPPVPTVPRNEPSDILGIVFAVILGAAVVGVNMIPGRRGHQD